jgi:hypothetical protein
MSIAHIIRNRIITSIDFGKVSLLLQRVSNHFPSSLHALLASSVVTAQIIISCICRKIAYHHPILIIPLQLNGAAMAAQKTTTY